ncbi:hypothetical protein ACT4UT_29145, partial [Bacillus sp. B-TM1]
VLLRSSLLAAVIDVGKDSIVVQVTGTQEKVEALIELLRPYGLKEIARTGVTAFTRSMKKQDKQVMLIQ